MRPPTSSASDQSPAGAARDRAPGIGPAAPDAYGASGAASVPTMASAEPTGARGLGGSRTAAIVVPGLLLSLVGVVLVGFNGRISVTSIPPLLSSLGLGGTAQSLLVTLPVLCFAAGAVAGPWLRSVFGEEKAIFLLMAILTAAIVLRGAFPTWWLFPGTLLAALAIAVLNVHIPSLVKRRFPERPGPGLVMALYTTAFAVGAGISAALALPAKDGMHSLRLGLGIWAIPALVALAVWYPQLRVAKPAPHRSRDAGPAPAAITGPGAAVTSGSFDRGIGRAANVNVWRTRLGWQVTGFLGTSSLIFYGVYSWLPQIDKARGIGVGTTDLVLLCASVFAAVGALIFPTIAHRMRTQLVAVVLASLIQVGGFLGLFLAPSASIVFWASFFGVGNGATLSLALLLIVLRSADDHVSSKLLSMAQSAGYLIAAAGPLVTGLLHTLAGGWTLPMVFLLLAALMCLVCGIPASANRVLGEAQ